MEAGADVAMTSADHPSGTDRLAEVACQRDWSDDSIVVNLQGDEPLMPVVNIQQVAMELAQHEDASVATLCEPVDSIEQLHDPGVVKGRRLRVRRSTFPGQRFPTSVTRGEVAMYYWLPPGGTLVYMPTAAVF